ncbi:sodium/calcium exchanger 1-like isoform X3 [Hemiscyllium ocellatum]|uniref:sodium/calcium exchanger 1-like isoform X3 n=1 Tax=Hemiscyllium ocellatum TaxID=170820 RepID=UPI0029676A75|nr:sodium/calcium exchanger 1-like isoform X3 [Hemiscyllium ocellatum]
MVYMFLGMSIIADRFMASIEVITSQEREITIKRPNGETTTTTVRIWNETVSNLTLMALGSSAPEILLSVIEVCGHNFKQGVLGPATIVGSAAFNMFIIIATCIYVVPDGESRKIKHLRVFFVTASWSIFAYIWLYLILAVISPGVVDIWEGLVTLFFFPVCVMVAWVADRRLLVYKYVYKKYRADKSRGLIIETVGERPPDKMELELDGACPGSPPQEGGPDAEGADRDQEEAERRLMARVLRELRQRHPDKDTEQLAEMANYQVLSQQQKSRAFYRIQATRRMTGAGNILKRHAAEQARQALSAQDQRRHLPHAQGTVRFEHAQYQCFENCGSLRLGVTREGGDPDCTLAVDFRTEDGTANAGSDYQFTEGTLVFQPGEVRHELSVGIIDDDIFEEDEYFRVHISNLRVSHPDRRAEEGCRVPGGHQDPAYILGSPTVATVTIFDDDHAGVFSFAQGSQRVSESVGVMGVEVQRTSGARGTVHLPYRTLEGTAKAGEDFVQHSGHLVFHNDEIAQVIEIQIIDDEEYEKNKIFFIELGDPVLIEGLRRSEWPVRSSTSENMQEGVTKLGYPLLGDIVKMEIVIEESYEFKSTVDKLIKKTNLALVVSSSSWREQFVNAVTVSAGEDDDEDGPIEERLPSCFDYIMHFLTVFWKVLFAFVPPTEYWNGWACFTVSIILIGVLTALTGDLATHFGCTVGLRSSVTAIVFVALGTSVPDTFASRVAAIQDQYADASIGNVTGSNAVNVFLGIGVAWSIAAIYWATKGQAFQVEPGNLAFSVTIFTIFAFIAIAILMYRRRPQIGGELGGSRVGKTITSGFFVTLWLAYVILSSLEAYCHINGF